MKKDPTNWHMVFWVLMIIFHEKILKPFCVAILIFIGFLSFMHFHKVEASVMSCKEVSKLSDKQVMNVYKSYQRGSEDDLGYTLAAIAWRESSLGKYRVNYRSNDYGVYGINLATIQRLEKTDKYYKTVEHIQETIFDDDKGAQYALRTLRWNLQYHKGDWRKAVMHYNKGNKWWLGQDYVNDISIKVRILRTCLPQ